MNIKMTLKPKE